MSIGFKNSSTDLKIAGYVNRSQDEFSKEAEKLSSGTRLNRAGEDPASLGQVSLVKAHQASLRQAERNTGLATSYIQVGEGHLNEISSMMIRLRELAVHSASDLTSDQEREILAIEFEELTAEIQRISQDEYFQKILNTDQNGGEIEILADSSSDDASFVKLDVSDLDMDQVGSTLSGVDLTSQSDALGALETIDEEMNQVSLYRSILGAAQNRLQHATNFISTKELALEETRSNLEDTDIAESYAKMVSASVKSNAGMAVLAQTNFNKHNLLKLLG